MRTNYFQDFDLLKNKWCVISLPPMITLLYPVQILSNLLDLSKTIQQQYKLLWIVRIHDVVNNNWARHLSFWTAQVLTGMRTIFSNRAVNRCDTILHFVAYFSKYTLKILSQNWNFVFICVLPALIFSDLIYIYYTENVIRCKI